VSFEPLPIRGTPHQLAMVDNHLATQHGDHWISQTIKTLPDAVVGIGVEIVERERFVQGGIDEHEIRVAAWGKHAFLRVQAQDLRGIGRGDGGKPLQGHVALGDEFRKRHGEARFDAVMAATHSLDGVAGQFNTLIRGVFVGSRGAEPTIQESGEQGIAILSEFDRGVGVDRRTTGFFIVLAGKLQVVVQGFALHRLALAARFGNRRHPLLGGGVHEIHPHLGMPGEPHDLAKR